MALVGTLRTFGAAAPLTSALGHFRERNAMMIAPLSIEGLFLLLLMAGSAIFAPLLIIAAVTRVKGKPIEWGGYLSLGIMFGATAAFGVFKRGVSLELLTGVVAFNGIALIVLAPAYLLVWWSTGKFMVARQHCKQSKAN